jgi:hypothetical protein
MTTEELKPANAGETPDLIRGPVVESKPKRPKRTRRVADEDELPDLIAAK